MRRNGPQRWSLPLLLCLVRAATPAAKRGPRRAPPLLGERGADLARRVLFDDDASHLEGKGLEPDSVGLGLGEPPGLLLLAFFDSVDDIVTVPRWRPERAESAVGNATDWEQLAPHWGKKELEAMFLRWETPAEAWRTRNVPPMLQELLSEHRGQACRQHCREWPRETGEAGCCEPANFCRRFHEQLHQVIVVARARYVGYYKMFKRRQQQETVSMWPFGTPGHLLHLLASGRLLDDLMKLLIFLFSRYPSSPALRRCLSSQYGFTLKQEILNQMVTWQKWRRMQEVVFWEVVATSRWTDSRWSSLGLQADALIDCWATGATVLLHLKRVSAALLQKMGREDGDWYGPREDWVGDSYGAPRTTYAEGQDPENLAAAFDGEYPGIILARHEFHGTWFLDKALLRYLMRNVLTVGQTLGEFGAFGGKYSEWLNETGVVEAFAFDGIPDVTEITDGRVQELQLSERFDLGRTFDWILCLEVGEHLQPGTEDLLMDNIRRHARVGAIISWATPDYPSPYHPNTLTLEQSTLLIERHRFRQDPEKTRDIRDAAETSWLKQTTGVYYVE